MKFTFLNKIELHLKKVRKPNIINKWYEEDYICFKEMLGSNPEFPIADDYPCLSDKFDSSGVVNGAYFHQDLYVARQIYIKSPIKHVDIGSRIDGFVAHVAVFREIEIIDIRHLNSEVDNIKFKQADLMSDETTFVNYCDSISCLHTIEHFGLGRYGDKIDPWGHIKGFENISRILKKGGVFYFSVPMGVQRIEFNAHRIFNLKYLVEWVSKDFQVQSFSYINDLGDFHENVTLSEENVNISMNCNHGCAVFVLIKK